jgi:hypothetical protein
MLRGVIRRLACIGLLLLLAGCAAAPATSSSQSFAPSPSAVVSESGAPASRFVLPFPVLSLPPFSRAQLGETLDLATQPGGHPVASLEAATEVVIVSGPREIQDATWYELRWPPDSTSFRGGWVRVDHPLALASVEFPCPDTSSGLPEMLAWDRVRCIAGAPVTIEGTIGHCQGGVVLGDPEWLAYACWAVSDGTGMIDIHASPTSGIVFPNDIVRARLTGHFDDPAASTCVARGDPSNPPGGVPSVGEQIFLCREAFVVDRYEQLEVIGTPPAA